MKASIPDDLSRILRIVRCELETYGTKQSPMEHSCIDAASLLTKVLHGLGVTDAYRLTVSVRVFNEAGRKYSEIHGPPFDEPTNQTFFLAGGAKSSVGRDAPEAPGMWRGHLTVIVPKAYRDRHALLDPSITQANLPQFGIILHPLCVEVDDDFITGKRQSRFIINNCELNYEAFPDDHSYNDAKDCMDKNGIDDAAADVIGKLKKPPVGPNVQGVSRNDPCPCGSGFKYKKCCGATP